MGHKLYSVERKSDFIHGISKLYNMRYTSKNIFYLLDSAISKRNYTSIDICKT